MTLQEFNKISKELNRSEYLVREGSYSTVYRKGNVTFTLMDDGYTSTIVRGKKKYIKNYNNEISEENLG